MYSIVLGLLLALARSDSIMSIRLLPFEDSGFGSSWRYKNKTHLTLQLAVLVSRSLTLSLRSSGLALGSGEVTGSFGEQGAKWRQSIQSSE